MGFKLETFPPVAAPHTISSGTTPVGPMDAIAEIRTELERLQRRKAAVFSAQRAHSAAVAACSLTTQPEAASERPLEDSEDPGAEARDPPSVALRARRPHVAQNPLPAALRVALAQLGNTAGPKPLSGDVNAMLKAQASQEKALVAIRATLASLQVRGVHRSPGLHLPPPNR